MILKIFKVFILPKIERNLNINASISNVFEILSDTKSSVEWNLAVNEIEELGLDKFYVKSNVGDFFYTRTELIENEKISAKIEKGIFDAMGYILAPKGDSTNVTIWGEFEEVKQEKILIKAGELVLKSLKSYLEYIEEGGYPDSYNKKQITVAP